MMRYGEDDEEVFSPQAGARRGCRTTRANDRPAQAAGMSFLIARESPDEQ